jgi:outer membrane receptor protein involved in Fe transport
VTKKHKMLHNKSALDFKKTRLSEAVTGAIFASFFVSAPLAAQQSEASSEDDVEVITVTATKRSESVQEVALAVTAITSDFMQKNPHDRCQGCD